MVDRSLTSPALGVKLTIQANRGSRSSVVVPVAVNWASERGKGPSETPGPEVRSRETEGALAETAEDCLRLRRPPMRRSDRVLHKAVPLKPAGLGRRKHTLQRDSPIQAQALSASRGRWVRPVTVKPPSVSRPSGSRSGFQNSPY
jgi:hypothetical protein